MAILARLQLLYSQIITVTKWDASFIFPTTVILMPAIILSLTSIGIYRAYISPLAKIPGPRLWAATRLPMITHLFSGTLPFKIASLHDTYGPVVRLAPNEVSFINEEAWGVIYGKYDGKRQMGKDPLQFKNPYSMAPAGLLFETDDGVHGRLRRNFSSAFSEKAVREQEPTVIKYIDRFMEKLHMRSSLPQDMCKWYNYVAFDHIGDLVFGESFHCLETDTMHAWITLLFDWAAGLALMGVTMRFGPLYHILYYLVPKSLRDADAAHRVLTRVKVDQRLKETEPRSDFLSHVIKTLDTPAGVSEAELLETCRVLVTGGSETTATLLSGLTYYLCTNPAKLKILTKTIRDSFNNPADIRMATVSKLDYLLATLNEGLRLYPPIPGNMRRYTPKEGIEVAGTWIPGNTLVAVDQYAANHSPSNFTRPKEFIPERWLPVPPAEFEGDNRKVVQPFSMGPRNCIGKTLAYMELRLILARVLYEFDIELADKEDGKGGKTDWLDRCDVVGFWKKPPLMIKLVPVVKEEKK